MHNLNGQEEEKRRRGEEGKNLLPLLLFSSSFLC
jgi:hypothetical protein